MKTKYRAVPSVDFWGAKCWCIEQKGWFFWWEIAHTPTEEAARYYLEHLRKDIIYE